MLPVRRGRALVEHVPAELPLFEDIWPRARRVLLIAFLALFLPLRLAEDHDIRRAGVIKRHVQTRHLAVHDDLVIVNRLDALNRANALSVATRRRVFAARIVLITPQGMVVHHILGRELAIAVVEWHALLQLETPGPAVLGHLPALGQPGLILAFRTDLEEPFKRRVVLDHVVRGAIDPRTPVVAIGQNQPHHQTVHLGLPGDCRSLGLRSPQP